MTNWQPIETAPKEKDLSLLVWDGQYISVAERLGDNSWIIANSYGFNEDGQIYGVTHWMPLPEPPK
jgi:hypothetical protein